MSVTEDTLTPDQIEKGLSKMTWQGLVSQVRITLTESVFLVGFAVILGAPNTMIGVLAAIPFVAQLLQIPSVYLIHKAGKRKLVNTVTQLGNRLAILGMALLPFLVTSETRLLLLVAFVGVQAIFNSIGSPSWNSWLRDLVPQDRLGRFFSVRMALTGIIAVVVSIVGGQFIGLWDTVYLGDPTLGYSILFFVAFLFGMMAVYFTATTPEPKMIIPEKRQKFSDLVAKPFKDDNFRKLMWFSVIWTFSTSLVAPFFTVYLIGPSPNQLNLGLPFATSLSALTSLVSIIFFRFWGRLSDKFSNKSILQVASPLFIIGSLLWIFATIAIQYNILIPLLVFIHILTGFASAGVILATANIGLKLAPRGEATAYLAARGSAVAVAGTAAPLIGGVLIDILSLHSIDITITWTMPDATIPIPIFEITGIGFVIILSAIIGLYALHKLSLIQETGEVEEKTVIDAIVAETRRNVRTLSTVDGLRQTFHLPVSVPHDPMKKKRKKKTPIDSSTPPSEKV